MKSATRTQASQEMLMSIPYYRGKVHIWCTPDRFAALHAHERFLNDRSLEQRVFGSFLRSQK